ncbi:RNA polymerase sigma factor [Brasilonema bromeliae]|uniref:Sigma-70 family RNA polymerase sigma factor n=1 Tax=Brasilonema bromeliae SPC951 TaxID=385972 RepID=A0ABX1P3G7_9CYAN|nr:sigma-70 family RNA polymerase sigma factor [Brasilonema bromeliae]NMG18573.1 sigma-70 family RNA polymerase sigma factor [Brasilonema bromeliae SPC951]
MKRQVGQPVDPSYDPELYQKQQLVSQVVEEEWQVLQRTIQMYVIKAIRQFGDKFGHSSDRNFTETVAKEIFHETVEEAFKIAGKFDPNRSARPWLLGIAAKKIQRWQRQQTQQNKRITPIAELPLARKLKQQNSEIFSEEEILGILYESSNSSDPEMLEYLLSLVNDGYREVLKLAFVDGLDGESLAAALGTTAGAAYTKKSRAIVQLRQAYAQSNKSSKEGR